MSVVTLTTDFGIGDYGAGLLSGVIWKIAPDAKVVELSNGIPPQDIITAQVLLEYAFPYFPDGTIHLVVVDPGVGTNRRPIAARLGAQFFVGPDNGLLTPLLQRAEMDRAPIAIVHTNNPAYWLPDVSNIFHGRDIFASVTGHLARGVSLSVLGDPINDVVRWSIPAPEMVGEGWRGQVLQIDHFGNLSTNIRRGHLEGMGAVSVTIAGQSIAGLSQTFGDQPAGSLIALIDSSNRLCISVVNGSAAARLQARPDEAVEVQPVVLGSSLP